MCSGSPRGSTGVAVAARLRARGFAGLPGRRGFSCGGLRAWAPDERRRAGRGTPAGFARCSRLGARHGRRASRVGRRVFGRRTRRAQSWLRRGAFGADGAHSGPVSRRCVREWRWRNFRRARSPRSADGRDCCWRVDLDCRARSALAARCAAVASTCGPRAAAASAAVGSARTPPLPPLKLTRVTLNCSPRSCYRRW